MIALMEDKAATAGRAWLSVGLTIRKLSKSVEGARLQLVHSDVRRRHLGGIFTVARLDSRRNFLYINLGLSGRDKGDRDWIRSFCHFLIEGFMDRKSCVGEPATHGGGPLQE